MENKCVSNPYLCCSHPEVMQKETTLSDFVKIRRKLTELTVPFLALEKNSIASVFLWTMQHFSEQPFYRTPAVSYSNKTGREVRYLENLS